MTKIIKTFFIGGGVVCPDEINKKLRRHYPRMKNNKGLRGNLYEINEKEGVIRYHVNQFEILTYSGRENYEIKSELEKILDIKLVEPH